MSKKPSYTMDFPRRPYWCGDTVDGFTLQLSNSADSAAVIPISVCAQIKDESGKVVYTYTPDIFPDGRVVFEDVVASWVAGEYTFDVEYTMGGGKKRTYVRGTLPIRGDVSKC